MRLAITLLALSTVAPLSAQIVVTPETPIALAFGKATGDLKFFGDPATGTQGMFLSPSGSSLLTGRHCSLPLIAAPIGKPDKYAARISEPADVESMPHAALPAPPCK